MCTHFQQLLFLDGARVDAVDLHESVVTVRTVPLDLVSKVQGRAGRTVKRLFATVGASCLEFHRHERLLLTERV